MFGAKAEAEATNAQSKKTGSSSTKLLLSQEGMDKIMRDILGSERGLAALAQGSNVAGIFGDSTGTLLAQKLITDTAGELAKLTAEQVTNTQQDFSEQTQRGKAEGGIGTVICSELRRQGAVSNDLYFHKEALNHFYGISPQTLRGYHAWAIPMASKMKNNPKLSAFWLPIVKARYAHVTGTRKNLLGWATIYIAQPICWVIGAFVRGEKQHGYVNS